MDFMYLVENLTEEGLLIAAMTAAVMGPVLNDTIAYTTDRKTFRNAHHAYSARPSLLADLANRGRVAVLLGVSADVLVDSPLTLADLALSHGCLLCP